MIIQRIADSIYIYLEYVKNKNSATEIWATLIETFEQKGIANRFYLIRKLLTMKYNEKDSLEFHFLCFNNIIRELQGSGQQMDKSFLISILLLTLPKSFNNIKIALDTVIQLKRTDQNTNFKEKSGVVFYGSTNKNNRLVAENAKFPFSCCNCDRIGHKRADSLRRHEV